MTIRMIGCVYITRENVSGSSGSLRQRQVHRHRRQRQVQVQRVPVRVVVQVRQLVVVRQQVQRQLFKEV